MYIALFFEGDVSSGYAWEIVLLEDMETIKRWCCAEHDYDSACDYIEAIKKFKDVEEIKVTFMDWREFYKYDVYGLTEGEINKLRELSVR